MSRVIWRPHQVRQQLNNRSTQTRTQGAIRGLQPTPDVGLGGPNPNLSSIIFHFPSWAGAFTSTMSDATTVRWACSLVQVIIDGPTTFGGDFDLTIYKNGTVIPAFDPIAITGAAFGQAFPCNAVPFIPNADFLSMAFTTPGSGNMGLVVRCELAS